MTAEDMRRRYRERKELGLELLGGVCVKCGSHDGLQFDHIDPATKMLDVTSLMKARMEVFLTEIQKCQLLCLPHHQEKTSSERESWKHGSLHGYMNKKCRCDDCRATYSAWRKERYQGSKV